MYMFNVPFLDMGLPITCTIHKYKNMILVYMCMYKYSTTYRHTNALLW
jgi:hypothetical protein